MNMIENKDYKLRTGENIRGNTKGLYLIKNLDNNMIKIGITSDIKKRFKQLIASFKHCGINPNLRIEYFIEYNHNKELEKWLHDKLKQYNCQNEWFDIPDYNLIFDKIKEFNYEDEVRLKFKEKGYTYYKSIPYNYYFRTKETELYNVEDELYNKLCNIGQCMSELYDVEEYINGNVEKINDINIMNEFEKLNCDIIICINNKFINYIEYRKKMLKENELKKYKEKTDYIIYLLENSYDKNFIVKELLKSIPLDERVKLNKEIYKILNTN